MKVKIGKCAKCLVGDVYAYEEDFRITSIRCECCGKVYWEELKPIEEASRDLIKLSVKKEVITETVSARHVIWGTIVKMDFEDFAWFLATMAGPVKIRVFYARNKLLFFDHSAESRVLENGRLVIWDVYYGIRYVDVKEWRKFILVSFRSGRASYVNTVENASGMDIIIPVVRVSEKMPPFSWMLEEIAKTEEGR